jgi:hypothetical protein
MAGLYSFNVLDSPEFIQAKKVERRIEMYDKKLRAKQATSADSIRRDAINSANELAMNLP